MAYKKSEKHRMITVPERDYHILLEEHIRLQALRIAGIEQMPIYQSIESILSDGHIELRINPLKEKYR
ncbi:hypothetical protein LJC45_04920 [Alistipes sp. OttesenSCG-928-B03]|nr:hypothetical protein [Alistipes sp. OttesenSCG-928-B03]